MQYHPLPYSMMYLQTMPAAIPPGFVLVHNSVRPATPLGMNGFRGMVPASCRHPGTMLYALGRQTCLATTG